MNFRLTHKFAVVALTALAMLAGGAASAQAQAFPTKPMKQIVPYGPGGPADSLGRAIADRLGKALGQPMVIENIGGAGTMLGADAAARAPADGYTVLLASFASFVSNPLLAPKIPYDVDRDFVGVGLVATTPMVMIVSNDLPVKTLKEFVAYAKANPGKLTFGSSGSGSTVHLAAELFKAQTGVDMVHVPYKSSAEVLNGLMGGQVQVAFDIVLSAKPQIEAGKVRALAVTDAERSALLPNVPTVAESGYPDYAANTWYGLATRRGTPQPVIDRLNAELVKIVNDPEMKKRFGPLAMELRSSTPEGLMQLAARERVKWGKIIADQGIKVN
jgi:tripartite-type tricarboxylate transporter receptor subunit TctC